MKMSDALEFYNHRALFVKKLEEVLLMLDDSLRGVDYRWGYLILNNGLALQELIRIDWHGENDPHSYVDVTGFSLLEIKNSIERIAVGLVAKGELPFTELRDETWDALEDEGDIND